MRDMNPKIEWFDDLKLGMSFASDKLTVTKEDILRFAAANEAARHRPHQMDRLQSKRRGCLYVQSDCDRAEPTGLNARPRQPRRACP
jgi:hypothetical protein